jgi:hypothetical protein
MRGTIADLRTQGATRAYLIIINTPWPYHYLSAESCKRTWTTDYARAAAFARQVDAEHHLRVIEHRTGLSCEVAQYPTDPEAVWPASILHQHRTAASDFRAAVKNWRVPGAFFDQAAIVPIERTLLEGEEIDDDEPYFEIVPFDSNMAFIVRDAS